MKPLLAPDIRVWLLAALAIACVPAAFAQSSLSDADENTVVRRVSFRFVDTQTFDESTLQEQIFTRGPSFWDRVRNALPLVSGPEYPLRPIEVQRDVVRLRRYYERQGFPFTRVDYPASSYNPDRNSAHIIFTITEGPPLLIEHVGFFTPEGELARTFFPPHLEGRWLRLRERVMLRTGERYTEFSRSRIEDEILAWLRDQGYAFARVRSIVEAHTATAVNLRFILEPGPIAYVDQIEIEGLERVSEGIVRRALPFREGDRFVHSRLIEGQRKLFGLRLFRVALVDVPPQEPDTTVSVRVRVREARPRYLSAQTGYSPENGIEGEASWRHRNLFGGAQEFVVRGGIRTGWLHTGDIYRRAYELSASYRQPHMFITDLSGIVAPFYEWRYEPNTEIAYQELGLNTTLLYEIHPFRTVTAQHTFARVFPIAGIDLDLEQQPARYNRSRLSLSANLGRLDNYFIPQRGFMVRPSAEAAGILPGSGVQFYRLANEVVGYRPLSENVHGSARLFFGRVYPFGISADPDAEQLIRLRRVRYLAGGANDVRGWSFGMLGPKELRGQIVERDGEIVVENAAYVPIPQFAKISANLETRFPFPGLGDAWSVATFFDFGQVADEPRDLLNLRYAVGTGLRYETMIGFIRLDLGFKLNPDETDLYGPAAMLRHRELGEPLPGPTAWQHLWRRANIHVSIGQIF
jgi:outer membrane protein insertion porin family